MTSVLEPAAVASRWRDKTMTEEDVVSRLSSGMTIGIGGWGSRRKPMSLVRAIMRSDLTDLTLVSFGGADVGMLCAAGKVSKLIFAFASLDFIALEPNFRRVREQIGLETRQLDEGMMLLALQAAAWRVPFLPTRVGLGSDVMRAYPELRTVSSPYEDGEELVAVQAVPLDAALVHVNRADRRGNGQVVGVDPYFDALMIDAATTGYVSCEELVEAPEFAQHGSFHTLTVNRLRVGGVVHAPNGAHPTSCEPAYSVDEPFLKSYAAAAKTADGWTAYQQEWLTAGTEADYQQKVNR